MKALLVNSTYINYACIYVYFLCHPTAIGLTILCHITTASNKSSHLHVLSSDIEYRKCKIVIEKGKVEEKYGMTRVYPKEENASLFPQNNNKCFQLKLPINGPSVLLFPPAASVPFVRLPHRKFVTVFCDQVPHKLQFATAFRV
jgi:hypothetical protein